MNELANLAEKIGVDIELVRRGIGADPRIGQQFLYAGCGYGGSCFPKDVKALISAGHCAGHELTVLSAVEEVNGRQKRRLAEKVVSRFGEKLEGLRFALWGLAFKPNTDDMREAPSRIIIDELCKRGATITAYDPVATSEARRVFADKYPGLAYAAKPMEAAQGADALIIVTEWKEFRSPDFAGIRSALKQPVIFDGRNLYNPAAIKQLDIEYHSIGRAAHSN
jgi:UDPglucose 6-dehydrogenase